MLCEEIVDLDIVAARLLRAENISSAMYMAEQSIVKVFSAPKSVHVFYSEECSQSLRTAVTNAS